MKFGAFNSCPKCKATPSSEDDLAISLGLSDHYFDEPIMAQIGADVAAGKPTQLDPETRSNLIKMLRIAGTSAPFFRNAARAKDIDYMPEPASKKPWRKKLF